MQTLDRFIQTLFTRHVGRRIVSWRTTALIVEALLTEAPQRFRTLLAGRTTPFAGLVREIVHAIRELKRFALTADNVRGAAGASTRTLELADILAAYNAFLDDRQWADARDAFLAVGATLADPDVARRWLDGIDWVVFDGFVDFSPSELPVVTTIAAQVETMFVFDRDAELVQLFPTLPELAASPSPRRHAGPFTATARAAVGRFQPATVSGTSGVRIIEARTREDETDRVASEVKRLLAAGAPQRDVAIAVPEMRRYAPLVEQVLAAHGVPCTLAWSGSLLDSPVAAVAMLLVETPARDFERADVVRLFRSPLVCTGDARERISSGALDALARNMRIFRGKAPWLEGLAARIAYLETQRAHPELGYDDEEENAAVPVEAQLEPLRALEEPFREALEALDELRRPRPAAEFLRALRSLLERFGILRQVHALAATCQDGRAHIQALHDLLGALDESEWLARACSPSRSITLEAFLAQLRSSLAETRPSVATPQRGVEVVDIRTAVERRTRHLFALGLVEGAAPVPRRRDALLSPVVRAALGLPTQEQLANEARVELYRALASADDSLTLCRPTHDEDTPLLPALPFERVAAIVNAAPAPAAYAPTSSRGLLCALGRRDGTVQSLEELRRHELFARMPALDAFAHGESVLRARNSSSEKPTPYAGRLSGALLDELRTRYGDDYQFSATELETYARCPFRFFAERVLRLEETLEPEEEITPLDKGTVLHAIFRDFYRRWLRRGRGPIAQDNTTEALELLRAIADEHLSTLPYQGAIWRKFRDRMTGHSLSPTTPVPGLLGRFLDVEMEKLASRAHGPRYLELGFGQQRHRAMLDERSRPEPLTVHAPGRRVLMHGVIDRIDTNDEHGTFCVLDYKSGSSIPAIDDVRRGPSLQLPVYVLAARTLLGVGYRLAAAGYYQTKDAADCGLKSVIADASLAETGAAPAASKGGSLQPAEVKEWLAEEGNAIARHVLGIEAGRFEVTHLDEERADCRSCDFKHICRYRGITLRTFERLS